MQPSQNCLNLIMRFEGCRLVAYQDQGGRWTIGYGHTFGVSDGLTITQAQANTFLQADAGNVAALVSKYLTAPPSQNQFDALVSLAYNIGPTRFAGSTLLRLFNAGDVLGAAGQFRFWNLVDGQVDTGLVNRRAAERALFVQPASGG